MKLIYRALLWLTVIAIPVVIAACYGVAYRYNKSGRVVDSQTGQNLNNIRVTCLRNGEDQDVTSTYSGEFYLGYDERCNAYRFEDEAGVYKPRTIPDDPNQDTMTVELSR